MNNLTVFYILLRPFFLMLRVWLTYNDEKEQCKCYFNNKSTF